MAAHTFEVLYGRGKFTLNLPYRWDVYQISKVKKVPIKDPENAILEKLRNPNGTLPLKDMVKPTDHIAICTTDISRPFPDYLVMPLLLKELDSIGVPRQNITILIGVGSHRPLSFEEIQGKFGYTIADKYRIINHNAQDSTLIRNLGESPDGIPRVINSILTSVNHIISLGVVEIHQYAGFSGGAKTIAIGCAGEETIKYTHSVSFLEKSGATPGKIEDNRFQDALWSIVNPLPYRFALNLVLNESKEIIALDGGDPKKVFHNLVKEAKDIFIEEVDTPFDIAYIGVPHPKDINLYQATRAATYQALAVPSALKKGAIINLICSCPEGFGKGVGENRFKAKLLKQPNPPAVLLSMIGKPTLPGEQRAYMVAKAMLLNPINVIGSTIPPEELKAANFLSSPLVPEKMAKQNIKALIMQDGSKKVIKLKE